MRGTAPGLRPVLAGPLVLLATALVATGCATGGSSSDNPFTGGGPGRLRVTVVNDNMDDVTVYLVSASMRDRLGRVTSHQEETFSVPWTQAREIRLELNFLAGPRCFSFPIVAAPGDELELVVRPGLSRLDCR